MCKKCVRRINKAKLSRGKIKFFAHYIDSHKFADIPLFADRDSNRSIEAYLYLIRQAKTKRRYSRREK
jgi:hypothetical protein